MFPEHGPLLEDSIWKRIQNPSSHYVRESLPFSVASQGEAKYTPQRLQ